MSNENAPDVSSWDYRDFLAYLLVYAASADLEMKPEEKKAIIDSVGSREFERIVAIFNTHNDYDSLQVIMELSKKFCTSEEQKEIILDDVKKIFFVDNEFSVLEENNLRNIRKLLS